MKILVSGLDGEDYRDVIRDAFPDTTILFLDAKDSLGLLAHVDLVICCHPKLLRLMYGPEDAKHRWQHNVHGWWKPNGAKIWYYSTTKKTLSQDMKSLSEYVSGKVC